MLLRHCPCNLDEFGQPRRNAGDCRNQNFFWRTILRASARMRRKKRKNTKKNPTDIEGNAGADELIKDHCCNNDRNDKCNDETQTEQNSLATVLVSSEATKIDKSDQCNSTNDESFRESCHKSEGNNTQISFFSGSESETLLCPDESILNDDQDSVFLDNTDSGQEGPSEAPDNKRCSRPVLDLKSDLKRNTRENFVQGMTFLPATVDTESTQSSNRNSGGKFSINRSKRNSPKQKLDKTPTPPPRSPLSLGLTTDVFQFPPATDEHITKISRSPSESPSAQTGRSCTTISESNISDEKLRFGDIAVENNDTEKLISQIKFPASSEVCSGGSETLLSGVDETQSEPLNINTLKTGSLEFCAYQNLPRFTQQGNSDSSQVIFPKFNGEHEKVYDPLSFETWTKATGDGKLVLPNRTQSDSTSAISDYVNLESPHKNSDDDDNSYVNFTPCSMVLPDIRKSKKKGKKMRSISLQDDFARYDDADQSVYHPVKALDKGYENFNGMTNHSRTYCNKLLTPPNQNNSHLNYVDVIGLPPSNNNNQIANSAHDAPSAPINQMKTYNKSDYTHIDAAATAAIQQTMDAYRQEHDEVNQIMTHSGGGKEPRCRKEITVK